MTDETSKSTAHARKLEAIAVKSRIAPPKSKLGPPRKKFSETFSAVTLLVDRYLLNREGNVKGDHQ